MKKSSEFDVSQLKGRNRRLFYEWQKLEHCLEKRSDITLSVEKTNIIGLPIRYVIRYRLKSICGVENLEHLGEVGISNPPVFATEFKMGIDLPDGYPAVDAPPSFCFYTHDEQGNPLPHPWHPNIRYFGDFAGRVCVNMADTYTDLVWGVLRIAQYLRYEIYHAIYEPPYPEDMKVAAWVTKQGEPNGWISFES